MALTITLAEDEDFYVGNRRFVLEEMFSDEGFILYDPLLDKQIEVGPEKAVEIMPDVLISEGHRILSSKTRVVFQADKSVKIYRGVLYRERGMGDANVSA